MFKFWPEFFATFDFIAKMKTTCGGENAVLNIYEYVYVYFFNLANI